MIKVQTQDFDPGREYQALIDRGSTGAIVTFTGHVRDFCCDDNTPKTLHLVHYPGMTEKVLAELEIQTAKKWPCLATRIIHRVGELGVGDRIVFVGVSAAHRGDAFSACEYVIDMLKTTVPLWKKQGGIWLKARASDLTKTQNWT